MNERPRSAEKVSRALFTEEGERRVFLDALFGGELEKRTALILLGEETEELPFVTDTPPSWCPRFIRVTSPSVRPGAHRLHDEGEYYCLDLSSVFAATALSAISTTPDVVLDICSAPGGKGIFAWRMFHPELLFCNEAIGKRLGALISNLKRCAIRPVMVASADTSVYAELAPSSADLVIVDAPCSGQSLIGKGKESGGCFHPSTINVNANRQRRIIANSAACVHPGGYLAYMTCTFSREENEGIIEWFLRKFPAFEAVEVPALTQFRTVLSDHPAYRLFPQSGLGAGAFSALFKRRDNSQDRGDFSAIRLSWQNE